MIRSHFKIPALLVLSLLNACFSSDPSGSTRTGTNQASSSGDYVNIELVNHDIARVTAGFVITTTSDSTGDFIGENYYVVGTLRVASPDTGDIIHEEVQTQLVGDGGGYAYQFDIPTSILTECEAHAWGVRFELDEENPLQSSRFVSESAVHAYAEAVRRTVKAGLSYNYFDNLAKSRFAWSFQDYSNPRAIEYVNGALGTMFEIKIHAHTCMNFDQVPAKKVSNVSPEALEEDEPEDAEYAGDLFGDLDEAADANDLNPKAVDADALGAKALDSGVVKPVKKIGEISTKAIQESP